MIKFVVMIIIIIYEIRVIYVLSSIVFIFLTASIAGAMTTSTNFLRRMSKFVDCSDLTINFTANRTRIICIVAFFRTGRILSFMKYRVIMTNSRAYYIIKSIVVNGSLRFNLDTINLFNRYRVHFNASIGTANIQLNPNLTAFTYFISIVTIAFAISTNSCMSFYKFASMLLRNPTTIIACNFRIRATIIKIMT